MGHFDPLIETMGGVDPLIDTMQRLDSLIDTSKERALLPGLFLQS